MEWDVKVRKIKCDKKKELEDEIQAEELGKKLKMI